MLRRASTGTYVEHAGGRTGVEGKGDHEYDCPIQREDGSTEWVHYRAMDTFFGSLPYWDRPDLEVESAVKMLAQQAVAAGATSESKIDTCPLVLVDAPGAAMAIAAWIERTF